MEREREKKKRMRGKKRERETDREKKRYSDRERNVIIPQKKKTRARRYRKYLLNTQHWYDEQKDTEEGTL